MFGKLAKRIGVIAEGRRKGLRRRVAAELRRSAPRDVAIEEVEEGVLLAARGLVRRSFVDPALRWIAARVK